MEIPQKSIYSMLVVVVCMAIIIVDLCIADIGKNPGKTTDISHM